MEKTKVDVLIVVDMQNDFVTGSLGTPEAQAIVPKVVEKIKNWKGEILYTQDTHYDNYLETQEGNGSRRSPGHWQISSAVWLEVFLLSRVTGR